MGELRFGLGLSAVWKTKKAEPGYTVVRSTNIETYWQPVHHSNVCSDSESVIRFGVATRNPDSETKSSDRSNLSSRNFVRANRTEAKLELTIKFWRKTRCRDHYPAPRSRSYGSCILFLWETASAFFFVFSRLSERVKVKTSDTISAIGTLISTATGTRLCYGMNVPTSWRSLQSHLEPQ